MNQKAFPTYHGGYAKCDDDGMTLRDYFAAKAMVVVMPSVLNEMQKRNVSDADAQKLKHVSAEACYGIADAMMKAREA
jgi:hypothetical protein